jgi:hypothetical protein
MSHNGIHARGVAWSPAPARLPSPYRALGGSELGQQGGFISSPTLNLALDAWTAATAAYLGWGFGRRGNSWSTFWYVVSAVSGFKALYDLSKMPK